MKLLIFGATGGTGSQLVQQALDGGHQVTAFARRPEAISVRHDRLKVHQGDATDAVAVAAAVAGQDVVLSAIGPSKGTPPGTLISTATKNILAGMKAHGVRRFVFESGIMVGTGKGLNPLFRFVLGRVRAASQALYEDKVIAEGDIRKSGEEWVIIRPPGLVHRPARGKYRVGEDLNVMLVRMVSHADVADLMLRAASDPAMTGKVLDISY